MTLKTNMAEENVTLDFRIKKIDETSNYLLDEVQHNDFIS